MHKLAIDDSRLQSLRRTFVRGLDQTLLLVASLLLGWCVAAAAVEGTNLPGRDYANFPAPSAFVCRTSCGGEAQCKAYTWVKPGIQGASGQCWLKDALPAIVKDSCCDSAPRSFIEKNDLKAENRINRPGADYRSYITSSWQDCQAACEDGVRCASWTYVRARLQEAQGRCWLKSAVARPVVDANTISGVKYRTASPGFRLTVPPGILPDARLH